MRIQHKFRNMYNGLCRFLYGFCGVDEIKRHTQVVYEMRAKLVEKLFQITHGQELFDLYSKGQFQPRKQLRFEVNLTDHCNLNCIGCMHFSPIAPKYFINIERFKLDCECLSKLSGGKCDQIQLMGGEPLLHPSLDTICVIVRNCFPQGKIQIVTYGVLLLQEPSSFWEILHNYHIEIIISSYPVGVNYTEIKKIAEAMKVKLILRGNANNRKQFKTPLDLEGKQNKTKSFYKCHRPNHCPNLRNGKIFPCPIVAYIDIFNDYFKKNLKVSRHDYINIYKIKSMDQISSFLCKPIPFCRYCNNDANEYDIDFSISKKEISEWI